MFAFSIYEAWFVLRKAGAECARALDERVSLMGIGLGGISKCPVRDKGSRKGEVLDVMRGWIAEEFVDGGEGRKFDEV